MSVAPFGKPVVPLVNWMFTASVHFSSAATAASLAVSAAQLASALNDTKPACAVSPSAAMKRKWGKRALTEAETAAAPGLVAPMDQPNSRSIPK